MAGSEWRFYWNENNLKQGIHTEGKAGIPQELERLSGAEAVGMERRLLVLVKNGLRMESPQIKDRAGGRVWRGMSRAAKAS